jgi:hypothetical protein
MFCIDQDQIFSRSKFDQFFAKNKITYTKTQVLLQLPTIFVVGEGGRRGGDGMHVILQHEKMIH